nr:NADP-dependent oxidoreductase [Deinococcus pimensis]
MKAVALSSFGDPSVLHLTRIPKPRPLPHEVLVRVHACGVNAIDTAARQGLGPAARHLTLPAVLGWEFAGTVEAVGHQAPRFRPGDYVYGLAGYPQHGGAYAEYLTVPAQHLAFKPTTLTHADASTVPIDALTALQALETLSMPAGHSLLLHPGNCRISTFAGHLARRRHVIVTDELDTSSPVDGVILIGTHDNLDVLKRLKPAGHHLMIFPFLGMMLVDGQTPRPQVHPSGLQLERLTYLIEQGHLPVPPADLFTFQDAVHAHRQCGQSGMLKCAALLPRHDDSDHASSRPASRRPRLA